MKILSVCLMIDGLYLATGKASQARLLADRLHRAGVSVSVINIKPARPGGPDNSPECRFNTPPLSQEISVSEIASPDRLKQLWLLRKRYKTVCFVGNNYRIWLFAFLKIIRKKVVILFSSRYQPERISFYQKNWLWADRLIAVSPALENDLRKSSGARAFQRKVVTILNKVDENAIREINRARKKELRKRLGLESSSKIVIFVGGVQYAKGVDLLLDSWRIVRERVSSAQLLILGPLCSLCPDNVDYRGVNGTGRSLLADKMEIFSSKLSSLIQLHERISYLGVKSDVSDYLAASDLFVFPSRTEVSPNAPMEAMAAGLPVIAFDNKEVIGEIVRNGREGTLVPDGDAGALAEAVILLLNDDETRRRLGENARQRFKSDLVFDDRQTKKFMEALKL
ncbi:MAG: glycosyltransferase family 4 protein [bacterium]